MTMGSLKVCKGDYRAWRGLRGLCLVPGLLMLGGCEVGPQGVRITCSKN